MLQVFLQALNLKSLLNVPKDVRYKEEESDMSTDAPIYWLCDDMLAYIMTFLKLKERLLAERSKCLRPYFRCFAQF